MFDIKIALFHLIFALTIPLNPLREKQRGHANIQRPRLGQALMGTAYQLNGTTVSYFLWCSLFCDVTPCFSTTFF